MCLVASILKVIILNFQAFNGAHLLGIYGKSFPSVFAVMPLYKILPVFFKNSAILKPFLF